MSHRILLLFFALMMFTSCDDDLVVTGMAPVYYRYDDFSEIKTLGPQPVMELGKILVKGDYIFVNDILKGIHVVDNSDPSNPVYLFFWKIVGNTQFSIEGNTLYASNGKHLLVIDITDYGNIKYMMHVSNFYTSDDYTGPFRPPEDYNGFFECVNPDLGILMGWEEKELINPLCRTR